MEEIAKLFAIMLMGYAVVKAGLMKSSESKSVSVIMVYLVIPCVIINAFQVKYTPDVQKGLILACVAAVAVHILFLILTALLKNILHLDAIERATVIYSNAGILVIPLVQELLGQEYVIYSSAYIAVQLILIWTHCKNMLCEEDKLEFQKIKKRIAEPKEYNSAVKLLSKCLQKVYQKNVIILIDEYDVPLENAYHEGFYDDMTNLIRSCFESALKTNPSLEFAVLTGCLRVSRESIFTGLNNLKTYSITKNKFSQYFGFTQEEMKEILQAFSLEQYAGTIAKWYDGYRFGLTEIYNPWSVLNCIDSYLQNDMVACEPYWSNTSSNRIVKRLIEESNERTKSMVEELINGTPIHTQIFEDVTYGTIDVNQDYIWSFLLFTGYLKIISCETVGDETYYDMVIPNVEIKSIYKNTIRSWFIDHINRDSRTDILESVIHADAEKLEDLLCTWLTNTISCFDEQENYYHGFVTGLVSGFNGYMVVSNRESGNGRFDLVVKQRSRWHHAAILEFKVVEKYNQMTKACEDALRQIEEKDYEASLRDEQYENIAKLGICFCQKRCRVKSGGVDHFEY